LSYVYTRSVLLFLHVRVEMAEEYEFLQIIEKLLQMNSFQSIPKENIRCLSLAASHEYS